MANEKVSDDQAELEAIALELYSKRVASHPIGVADTVVMDSFRKAETFLKVKKQIRNGGLKAIVGETPAGADCRCPNQAKSHPYNLVSQVDGNLEVAGRVKKFLDTNPTPAGDDGPQELLTKFRRTFPDMPWGIPEINIARSLLPAYCKN